MHERSLAQAVIHQVTDLQPVGTGVRIKTVYLQVGEFAGVDVDLFRAALEEIAECADWHTQFVVETVRLSAQCQTCSGRFDVEHFRFVCVHCGSRAVTIERGEEVILQRLEVEMEEPCL